MGPFYKDVETSLYYLNSRYYNPEIGRFINADGLLGPQGDILGHNMYAYCQNNPVMYYDPTGEFIAITTIILYVAIAAGVAAFTYTAVDSYNKTGEVDWLGATVNGFLTFGTVYTMGMFAYESYLMLSLYMGWNPVVGIGAGGLQYLYNTSSNSSNAIQTYWPPNNGFKGKPTTVTLQPGTNVYRYGGKYGNYVAPEGTPGYQLSLPPDKMGLQPTTYEILKPIPGVQSGTAAPWFNQVGGGIQYLLPYDINYYLQNGYMR